VRGFINKTPAKKTMSNSQTNLGFFSNFSIKETKPVKINIPDLSAFWEKHLRKYPGSIADPKIQICGIKKEKNNLELTVAKGIDYRHVQHALKKTKQATQNPLELYTWNTQKTIGKTIGVNALSVAGLVVCHEHVLFGIRDQVDLNRGTISIINGYVDPEGPITKDHVLKELAKELKEELGLVNEYTTRFICASQSPASCDLLFLVHTIKPLQNVLVLQKTNELKNWQAVPFESLSTFLTQNKLNPLIISIKAFLTSKNLRKYLP